MADHQSVSVAIRIEDGYNTTAVSELKRTILNPDDIEREVRRAVQDAQAEVSLLLADRAPRPDGNLHELHP